MLRTFIFALIVSSLTSCVSDKEEGVIVSDATLFSLLQNNTSFSYYKNSTDTLTKDQQSPHGSFVRIRFNPTAVSAMNDSLSGLNETVFPDESMVVKEVYFQKGGPLKFYEVMYKLHNAANNGSGWIWSEMNPDGSPRYSSASKGDQCVGCHSNAGNNDLIRTFGLH